MKLVVKKYVLAFLLGFAPVFLLGLVELFEAIQEGVSEGTVNASDWGWFLLSLLSGSIATAIRYVLVAFNFMPTDRLHGPNAPDTTVTVTKDS